MTQLIKVEVCTETNISGTTIIDSMCYSIEYLQEQKVAGYSYITKH